METLNLTSASISFALITVLICAWRLLNWVWLRPKRLERYLKQQGLAGNSYKLLHGDLKEMSMMIKEANSKPISLSDNTVTRVLPFHSQLIQKHGKNCFFWNGPIPRLMIMEPELIRDILTKYTVFRKPGVHALGNLLVSGLLRLEGEQWAKHRKIINPAFHLEKLKDMLPAFHSSCSEVISKWEKIASTEGFCELDVWPYLENLSGDVISRTAFGSSYEDGRRIFQLLKDQARLTVKALQSVYIPGWRFLPTKMNKRMKEIDKEIHVLLRGIISKREKAMKEGETANKDLLGILMESNIKEIEEYGNNKEGMSIKEVIEECKLFYLAGQDSTSTLILWSMVHLSMHQDWQLRAREEVLQVFGHSKPDADGLNHLKTIAMIFNEVLRLYPAAVVISRTVHEDIKLGEMYLPAGVQICIPTILVHQDHEIWGDDAKEFKPERFSQGVSKLTKRQVSFFPFGWGPRVCIGQNFALMEAKMALAMILQCFSFQLSPSYVHAPLNVITVQPQYGAHLILRKL